MSASRRHSFLSALRDVFGLPMIGAIAAALILAVTVTGDSALAQRDAEALDPLEECARIPDRDARLDCLDAVLAERGQASPSEASPPPAPSEPAPASEAAAAAAAATTAAAAAAASADDSLSRRERRQRERERETQTVTIVDVQINALGHSMFVTADEDQWISVNTPEFGYPDPPFDVTLEPGSGGSSFLGLPNRNRRLRVDRVE